MEEQKSVPNSIDLRFKIATATQSSKNNTCIFCQHLVQTTSNAKHCKNKPDKRLGKKINSTESQAVYIHFDIQKLTYSGKSKRNCKTY